MDSTETVALSGNETKELLATFAAMAPLLQKSNRGANADERDTKKVKTQHRPAQGDKPVDLHQVVFQMARLLIKLDSDQNLLRKQDSFVFYMQMEPESVIHELTAKAKSWHQEMAQPEGQMRTQVWKPLRVTLMQTLAQTLQHRLMRLYNAKETDALWQTALQHHLLTAQGEFYFQRWDPATQKLTQTDQTPIGMDRIKRYVDQLVENTMEPNNILKFHALKASGDQRVTPWLLQISLRCDELQHLLETLAGCKVWNLLGATLKLHTLHNSSQALQLQNMMGKGKSAGKGKQSRQ